MKVLDKKKETGAHFTPPELAKFVARKILKYLDFSSNINILDPSCGDGELLFAILNEIPLQYYKNINIIGVESDLESLKNAASRLKVFPINGYELIQDDFLELTYQDSQRDIFSANKNNIFTKKKIDVIIANPPYVRTQILGSSKAQELATLFHLKGRVDLYHAFLVAMTQRLTPNGLIGVITSNRFISTKGGASLRKLLNKEYNILELYDLGDTKLFQAAVLPAVFIGNKKSVNNECATNKNLAKFLKIYEDHENNFSNKNVKSSSSIYNILEMNKEGYFKLNDKHFTVTCGNLRVPDKHSDPWLVINNDEYEWINKIESNSFCVIADLFKVRVGIKTTADKVFIRKEWNNLPSELIPENELIKPLLSNKNSQKWKALDNDIRKVLYPHKTINSKRIPINLLDYPNTAQYFESNRDVLEKRTYLTKSNRNWYEIWVPHNPDQWKQPKIVFPDISPSPKFFLDKDGSIVDGNCYWITLDNNKDFDLLYLIIGIANSSTMTKYHDLAFNNKLYAGRRRYLTQYVEKYPLPDPKNENSIEIIKLVKKIIDNPLDDDQINSIEIKIEHHIRNAFELSD